jgi:tetratricopeptide (TPR) repeat protein
MARVAEALTLRSAVASWLCAVALSLAAGQAQAGPFDEMSLERWAKLREAERYQLKIAEKFYIDSQWKVAADEYEKFLKLYDKSEGAPYAQLKWSHCMVQLRRHNTAIKDGYQSTIDYFPEAPEAITAALCIGRTLKETGDLRAAKKAYEKLIKQNPKHLMSVYARSELAEIAGKESDTPLRVALLKELTYDIERKGAAAQECVIAARELARHYFGIAEFEEGLKALGTTVKEDDIPLHLMHPTHGAVGAIVANLTGQADEKAKRTGEKLADLAIAYLRTQLTADLKDDKRRQRWYFIADLQFQAHRPDKEREVYEQMLATLGQDDPLLERMARWYKQNGKRDLARTTYLKYKDPIEGQRHVAESWVEEKKFDQAVAVYRDLALKDVKNASKWQKNIARTYRGAGKPDLAVAVYRDLLISDPKNAEDCPWEIAETFYQAGRWKEAIDSYRGIQKVPESYWPMAYAHRQLKQFDEAISLYAQVLASHPPSASQALIQIAYTQEQAGRKELAIKTFKQVCDRYPKTGQGSEAHAHLNNVYKITVTLGGAKD